MIELSGSIAGHLNNSVPDCGVWIMKWMLLGKVYITLRASSSITAEYQYEY